MKRIIQLFIFGLLLVNANADINICIDSGHDIFVPGKYGSPFVDKSGYSNFAMISKDNAGYSLEYIPQNKLEIYWEKGYRFYNSRLIDAKTQLIKELSVLGQLYRTNEIEAIADAEE
jgi:hypothetical protein